MARLKPLPKPTLVDRAVGVFSPAAELKRLQARQAMDLLASGGGYTTVRKRRGILGGWSASDPGPNSALLPDLPELRAESRELYRTAPLARGAVSTVVTNVVGTGLQPRPVPDAEGLGLAPEAVAAWKKTVLREWCLFADSAECDLERTLNFAGLQNLALRTTLRSGDCFVVKRFRERAGSVYGLKLHLLDADRCSNPNRVADRRGLAGGIETDTDGAPLQYWFTDRHPGEYLMGSTALNWTPIAAFGAQSGQRQVLHLYHKIEPELLRGEPYLTPVVELLKQLTDYSSAEITAAVVNSCFAVVSKIDGAQGVDLEASSQNDGKGQPINLSRPGQIVDLGMNESLESFSPNRPSAAFDPFVLSVLRQIGVALELPFEVLIKHFESSYSAARAALLEVWKFYRGKRDWLAFGLCQPVYEALVTEAVARGRLVAPGFLEDPGIRAAWLACEWHGPSAGSIDPLRETQALELQMRIRTKTLSQATTELNGTDVIDNLDQIAVEQGAMAERSIVQIWSGAQAGVVTQEQAQTDQGEQPGPTPQQQQQPGGQQP